MSSPSISYTVPTELYREILQYVSSKRDLCSLSVASRNFQAEAEHFIYQFIESTHRPRTIYLCDLISSSPRLHTLVRSLSISNEGEEATIAQSRDYWERVARLLRDLPNLEELKLHDNMATGNTNSWVLSQCSFSLQKLDCDFAFDSTLLTFLQSQRNLKRLYWTESYSDDESERVLGDMDATIASSTPPITELMTNSPRFALSFMPAATLTHVWILGPCGYENEGWVRYVEEFSLSARSLLSLRMNFPIGRRTLVTVLNALADSAPDLRSLGFVPYFDKQHRDVINALSRFTKLESLVMWSVINADTSREVAKACPSLRTVACLHYSYCHEYVILPVNPLGTPKAHHDPDFRLWKDG